MSLINGKSDCDLRDDKIEEKNVIKKKKIKKGKDQDDKEEVDTSNFTIEERLVAAVWVHERKLERVSIAQIKVNFRMRFGKPPPTKNTLYFWEKKIFATGKVMDAKRSGRPCRRKAHIPSVEASLKQAPGLSLRARAEQLCLPRTTLKKILKDDLQIKNNEQVQNNNANTNHLNNENTSVVMQRTPKQQNIVQQNVCTYTKLNNQCCPGYEESAVTWNGQQINHHPYISNNQVIDTTAHLAYTHTGNNHNNTRNQINQSFYP